MLESKDFETLNRILELLETACEAAIELQIHCAENHSAEVEQLIGDLLAVVSAISASGLAARSAYEHAGAQEMLENVADTLESISAAADSENWNRAATLSEFQLLPFLRLLREAFYFWGTVYPDKARMDAYYKEEFAEHYKNLYVQDDTPLPYRLTVVVTGYNHLETTKLCVQQLLKETDFEKLNAELILIDHGSTDGTLEYFESLGIGKIIHFKKNVRINVLCFIGQICRSEFFAFVSNDVLVTHNWADNLIDCMESDPLVILAVPATPSTSNLQWVQSAPETPDAFIQWADKHNDSNTIVWEDRARLMPNLGIYRTNAVNKIGYADPLFYSMEFWDDDFSLRARRAGYRQVLCGNVACYHFGSVTGKAAQKKEDTLVYGRELFRSKNSIDAWGNGFCYDYTAIRILKQKLPEKAELSVLGLDCGMGDTLLQIRNELRRSQRSAIIYQMTSQKEYLPDQAPFSNEAIYSPKLSDGLQSAFGHLRFDCIYLGRDIAQYDDYPVLLKSLANRLASGGCFVCSCANPFYVWNLHRLLHFSMPEDGERFAVVHPMQIDIILREMFSQSEIVKLSKPIAGIDQFVLQHYGKKQENHQLTTELQIEQYYFVCTKQE